MFLGVVAWLGPLAIHYLSSLSGTTPVATGGRVVLERLAAAGVTQDRAVHFAMAWSALMLLWLYREFTTVVVTPTAIVRRLVPLPPRTLRWEDADEILIEHIARTWEGRRTARKTLTVFARRRWFLPWRRAMRVTNRQIEGYHRVEHLAVGVSVPAIARRKRQRIAASGRPAVFTQFEASDAFWLVFWAGVGISAAMAHALDKLWVAPYDIARPAAVWLSGAAAVLSLRRVLFRQVAVGASTVHIMFCGVPYKAILVESIVSMKANDNGLKIFARKGGGDKARCVFRTRRFIRNRGVLLRLVRELQNERTLEDQTPIVPVRAVGPARPSASGGSGEARAGVAPGGEGGTQIRAAITLADVGEDATVAERNGDVTITDAEDTIAAGEAGQPGA